MAQKVDKDGYCCKMTHHENGKSTQRRINSMVVQSADGRVHLLTKEKLPDAINLYTGDVHSGEHTAEVLLNPKPPHRLRDIPKGWPEGRDLLHVVIGFLLLCGIELLIDAARNVLATFRM